MFIAPDVVQQHVPGDHFPLVPGEILEHFEFPDTQLDGPLPLDRFLFPEIQVDVPHRILCDILREILHPAQECFHTGNKLPRAERFGHVVIRAYFKPQNLVHLPPLARQHQDGDPDPVLPQIAAYLLPVPVGEDQVKRYEIH